LLGLALAAAGDDPPRCGRADHRLCAC
jgi:hypothetical protein